MKKNETTELTVVERAALALGTSEREAKLAELVKQSETIVEIKNAAARDQCHGAAMVLRTTRVEIEKAGKAAREDATAFSKAVIAEEKRLLAITQPEETRLIELRDAWDERIAEEKRAKVEAEARRIAGLRAKIDGIRAYVPIMVGQSSDVIETTIKTLVALPIEVANFAELTGDAEMARGETLEKLRTMHAAAVEREAEARRVAEESERLARERAAFEEEQRRAAAERAKQERKDAEARAAREAEERKQREAEEAVRREALAKADAIMRAEREAHEQRMAAERAEMQRRQDEASAEQRRAAAELQRQQDEHAAQRRAEADAAAAKQREADLAAARKARAEAERVEAERLAREAADTAIRNAAPTMLEALEHIAEYWNRDRNDEAMHNALLHIIETAESAIAVARQPEAQAA